MEDNHQRVSNDANRDNNDSPSSQAKNGNQSVAKIDPLTIPEILMEIMTFLDRPSLYECAEVSRFWRLHAISIIKHTYKARIEDLCTPTPQFRDVDSCNNIDDDIEEDKGNHTNSEKLQEFSHICPNVEILEINMSCNPLLDLDMWKRHENQFIFNRLVRLNFCLCLDHLHDGFFSLLPSIVSKARWLRELEIIAEFSCNAYDMDDNIMSTLKSTMASARSCSGTELLGGMRRPLKRFFTFTDKFRHDIYLPMIFWALLETTEDSLSDSLSDSGSNPMDSNDNTYNIANINNHGALEELKIISTRVPEPCRYPKLDFNLRYHGLRNTKCTTVALRSLVIINFENRNLYNPYTNNFYTVNFPPPDNAAPESNCSILSILGRCPLLENLCISFDLSLLNNRRHKAYDIQTTLHDLFCLSHTENWVYTYDNFVAKMHEYCPRLRSIDFALKYDLTSEHWIEMMDRYGPQLESLNIFGVRKFTVMSLLTLIGPPINHPIRTLSTENMHRLTSLNVNGNSELEKGAFMIFKHLRALKALHAREISLDASFLIGFDWVFKDIETLEIRVGIPERHKEPDHPCQNYTWDDDEGHWYQCEDRSHSFVANFQERYVPRWRSCSGIYVDDFMRSRVHEKEEEESNKGSNDDFGLSKLGLEDYQRHVQIKICEQLGRLTKLKWLALEG
ncbi:hypothetical protein BX616_005688, partial [Lobosporangium transversale]